tara:strand:- start:47 stop:433 length:387 start_codon:yes stop_codon:yes gene_type:complete
MTIRSFLLTFILFLFACTLLWYFIKQQKFRNEVIKVNITLQNNCELIDSAFMVSSHPENKNAHFENKKAIMYLKRSSKVQLQANNKYEGFHYSSIPVKVEKEVILEANCTEEGRLEDIFNSLKEQFKE